MAKKMSRKKFVKKMMSVGISRNVANWAARTGITVGATIGRPPTLEVHKCLTIS